MPIETLDDIIEELADLIGIYGEDRSHWVSEISLRLKKALFIESKLKLEGD